MIGGWLAFALVVLSFYMLGIKDPVGWLVGACACGVWIFICLSTGNWAMLAQQLFLFVWSIVNYHRWQKGNG